MRGQEQALTAILEEARSSEGGVTYVHICHMSDELGIRLSLDTQKILLPHQKRSRWPVERVRYRLSSLVTSVVSVLFGFRINQLFVAVCTPAMRGPAPRAAQDALLNGLHMEPHQGRCTSSIFPACSWAAQVPIAIMMLSLALV